MPTPIFFHESQYPEAVRAGLVRALTAGRVPGRFLYDSPGQAARWLAYHNAWSPSRTAQEVEGLYEAAFEATRAAHPDGVHTYVGLGCGGGTKDARFLARGARRYVAVDTSPALVLEAGAKAAAARADVDVDRLVVDLAARPDRGALLLGPVSGAVVWSAFGLVPNLDAQWLLPWARGLLAPQDSLLLSVNLSPTPYPAAAARIVPQYDNPEARAWYRGALDELGISTADADLELTSRPLADGGAVWRIEFFAELKRAKSLRVFDQTVELEAGQRLEVFHSDRYLPEALPELFAAHGLAVEGEWLASNREEGVYRLTAAQGR